ncbi:MAG: hypothetical protein AAGF11_22110 [Myxococcota bacterium]
MAVTEIKEALRTAANTVSKYVGDVAVLQVETQTLETAGGKEPVLAARTIIKLDGDNTSVVPGVLGDSGKWEIDTVLYDLHLQNVRSAIDYRARMVESMLTLLRPISGVER